MWGKQERFVLLLVMMLIGLSGISRVTAQTRLTFQPPQNYIVGDGPSAIAVGDFNGDGRPDLAVVKWTSNSVSILINTTTRE